MKQLSIDEQRKMVQMGVTCSSTQLLRTGIVHADPHEGNMLFTDDGRLAMLDFGLMCRVENDKQVRPCGRLSDERWRFSLGTNRRMPTTCLC